MCSILCFLLKSQSKSSLHIAEVSKITLMESYDPLIQQNCSGYLKAQPPFFTLFPLCFLSIFLKLNNLRLSDGFYYFHKVYPQKQSYASQGGDQGMNWADGCPSASYPWALFLVEGPEHSVLRLVLVSGCLRSAQLRGHSLASFPPKPWRKLTKSSENTARLLAHVTCQSLPFLFVQEELVLWEAQGLLDINLPRNPWLRVQGQTLWYMEQWIWVNSTGEMWSRGILPCPSNFLNTWQAPEAFAWC